MNAPANASAHSHLNSAVGTVPGRQTDVIVLGGGPAGASTALALASSGFSVTIFERSRFGAARIGETLPPHARQPLTELGVWDRFLADGHLESPGVVSVWGRTEPYENDFIVNPYGPGWHLDRGRFDAMLAHAAAKAGAELLAGARPSACTRGTGGAGASRP